MAQQLDVFSATPANQSQELSNIEQRLAELRDSEHYEAYVALALLDDSAPQELWRVVLREANILLKGNAYTRKDIQSLAASGMKARLLKVPRGSSRVEVRADLRERLARDLPLLPSRQAIEEALLAEFCSRNSYTSELSFRSYDDALRASRLGLVTDSVELLNSGLMNAQRIDNSRWRRERPILQMLANPTADDWLDRLPANLAGWVLNSLRMQDGTCLGGRPEWLAMSARFLQKTDASEAPVLLALLWEDAFLRGDSAAMDQLEDSLPEWQKAACIGTRLVGLGQLDVALECYEKSLKLLRKASGKRTAYFPDVHGLFYLLLLTFPTGAADIKALTRLSRQADKSLRPDLLYSLRLLEFLEARRGNEHVNISPERWFEESHWFAKLLAVLSNHWFDNDYPELITKLAAKAADEKLGWLQKELQAIHDKTPAENPEGRFYLHNLYQHREPWQRKLEALRMLGGDGKTGETASATGSDARLIWLLDWDGDCDYFNVQVHVKEQKRKGKGWTKGRAVALKRLHHQDVDCMDEADQRAADSIEIIDSYNQWGSEERYSFHYGQLIAGLVGHPRVFSADRPEFQLELVQREPVLLVRKTKQSLEVALEPEPEFSYDGMTPWLLFAAGGNRVEYVPYKKEHLQIADLLGEGGMSVPLSAEEAVLATIRSIAPMIGVHSDIGGGVENNAQTVDAAKTLFLFISPLSDGLHIYLAACPLGPDGPRLQPGHGVANVIGFAEGEQREAKRDLEKETAQLTALLNAWPGFQTDDGYNASLADLDDCLELLEILPTLNEHVTPVWPEGESLKLSHSIDSNSLNITVSSQQNWFALDGEIKVNNELLIGMSQLLALSRETSSRYLPLGDGQYLNITQQLRKQLSQLADASETHGKKQRLNPYAIAQLEGLDDAVGKFKAPQKWKQQTELLRTAMASEPELPNTFQAELRDYQLDGYRWLMRLAGWGAGAVLADDMGLGKTLQALAALLAHAPNGPSLVVAPTSVAGNWIAEAQRFAPSLAIHRVFSGSQVEKLTDLGAFDVVVTSYGIMQQGTESLAKHDWQILVLDEAQAVKNAATKRAKAARELPAKFRLLLTGTPVENHLGDLWSLLAITNPGLLGSQEKFNKRFVKPIVESNDEHARQALRRLVQPFILRRTKQAVLDELPPRTEINLHVELDDAERALYEAQRREALERLEGSAAAKQDGHRQLQILAEITRLRRACCHPTLVMPTSKLPGAKLQQLLAVVAELRDNGHRALVFSQFVDHLSIIRKALDQAQISYQYIDGSTAAKKRDTAVKAFQAGEGDLFLISLKAGGFGLNLTAADYVIHMDPWWNPAVEDQASDRAHRMGQTRPVTIYRLITSGTIEDKIVALHQKKRGLADSLLAGTDQAAKMNADAVLELLKEA